MQIKNISIKNFKSLKEIDIKLNNLTLITGVNSSGKSSFIQAILLFKQNQEKLYSLKGSKIININDKYVKLGKIEDILYEEVFDENIQIKITNDKLVQNLVFSIKTSEIENIEIISEEREKQFNIFFDDFQYIETDRISPKISYSLSHEEIENNLIGTRGEYTAHYLAENRHKNLTLNKILKNFKWKIVFPILVKKSHNFYPIKALKHPESITSQLLESVSLWLGEISSDIEVEAKLYKELNQVALTYNYKSEYKRTEDYTPLNVGFGITYVLPIIVAILKAKKGDLLIIENPESHLHPAGQSKIAELCAIASANGVQIIVETHSDHFLNGIMIATKNKTLKPEESKVYFFKKEQGELETKIDELNINSEGKIDKWPKKFFDQYENDMMELL